MHQSAAITYQMGQIHHAVHALSAALFHFHSDWSSKGETPDLSELAALNHAIDNPCLKLIDYAQDFLISDDPLYGVFGSIGKIDGADDMEQVIKSIHEDFSMRYRYAGALMKQVQERLESIVTIMRNHPEAIAAYNQTHAHTLIDVSSIEYYLQSYAFEGVIINLAGAEAHARELFAPQA